MSDTVLVTDDAMDFLKLAKDDKLQAVILRDYFKADVNIFSSQTSQKKIALITQAFGEANKTQNQVDTTGFAQKEDAYTEIALNLHDLLNFTATNYTNQHDMDVPRLVYLPRIHPMASTKPGFSLSLLEASVVFKGEYMYFGNSDISPEVGDIVIAKGFETIKQGNIRDDLATYTTNSQSSRKTSMGLSIIAFPALVNPS